MSTNIIDLAAADIWSETQYQYHPIGARGVTADGRVFRYAKMGEAITKGYLTQSPAIDTATITMAVTAAAAIGAKEISFTHGATTSTANEYAEGFLTVSYGTGIGQTLKIASHAAFTSGGASTIYLEDPLIVALDTTSKIDITHNPWRGVLMDTSQVTVPTGVALRAFTSGYYGWLQTRGVCGVFADNTITAGYEVNNDASVSGAIDVAADNEFQKWDVGRAIQAGAQNYAHQVFLRID